MKKVDLKDAKKGDIYCYYEITNQSVNEKWLAFCKVVHIEDNEICFKDICPFLKRNEYFLITSISDPNTFEVGVDFESSSEQTIMIFQLTEAEILRHVVAEYI